jgi:hypothetical protein
VGRFDHTVRVLAFRSIVAFVRFAGSRVPRNASAAATMRALSGAGCARLADTQKTLALTIPTMAMRLLACGMLRLLKSGNYTTTTAFNTKVTKDTKLRRRAAAKRRVARLCVSVSL